MGEGSPLSPVDVPPPDDDRQLATGVEAPATDAALDLATAPQPRPRPPWSRILHLCWRVLAPCLKAAGVLIATQTVQLVTFELLLLARGLPLTESARGPAAHPVLYLASYLPAVAVVLASWRLFERADLVALGHRGPRMRALPRMGLGILFGGGLMGTVVGLGIALGGWSLRWEPAGSASIAAITALLVVAAYFEELVMRGYLLQILGRRFVMLGLAVTSVLFAALHLANPGAHSDPLATLLIVGNIAAAGLLMGTAFLRSQDLWWPVGIHLGWNWTQGVLLGLPVSGVETPSLFHAAMLREGSPVFGAQFGPESSLLGLLVVGLAAAEGMVALIRRPRPLPVDARRRELEGPTEPAIEVPARALA